MFHVNSMNFRPGPKYLNRGGVLHGSITIGAGSTGREKQESGGVCWEMK
jgi:hypothetical protein